MSPLFIGLAGKKKVVKDSFNQFVYNLYPQSILILEEYLQKCKPDTAFECFPVNFMKSVSQRERVSVRERNVKLLPESVAYIAITETVTCILQ